MLTDKQIELLKWAAREAECWEADAERGSLRNTPTEHEAFLLRIDICVEALVKLRRMKLKGRKPC